MIIQSIFVIFLGRSFKVD